MEYAVDVLAPRFAVGSGRLQLLLHIDEAGEHTKADFALCFFESSPELE